MAKKGMIERERKRQVLVQKFLSKRVDLLKQMKTASSF